MQVFGLPGHVIRNGRAATRLLDAKPHEEAARRRDALAPRDGRRPERRDGGARRGRCAPDTVPVGESARAEVAPTEGPAQAQMAARPRRGGRGLAGRQSDVGQEKDRQADRQRPVRGQRHSGRQRIRVQVSLRGSLPGQRLELVVLPPKRPDLNGCVERAPSSWRYEFYPSYDLPVRIDKLQPLVDAFAHRYNHHRPHQALGDLTPAEYLRRISPQTPTSHKC